VGPGGVGQLPEQGRLEGLEPLPVGGRQPHPEGIGRDQAVDADRAAIVHLPGEAAADLYGLEAAAEGPGEDPLDERLETALEPVQTHVAHPTGAPRQRRATTYSG